MSHLSRPMGIPQTWNARQAAELDRRAAAEPDDRWKPTSKVKTGTEFDRQLAARIETEAKARQHAAGADARCRAIQARIFQQIAVGGVRNGK